MSPAHQRAQCQVVEFFFGFELARARKHELKIAEIGYPRAERPPSHPRAILGIAGNPTVPELCVRLRSSWYSRHLCPLHGWQGLNALLEFGGLVVATKLAQGTGFTG